MNSYKTPDMEFSLCGLTFIDMKKCLCVLFFLPFGILGCRKSSDPNAEHIKVVMKKYSINPAMIHVKAGKTTEIEVSTADVQHGFDVPGLNIKEPVRAGQPTIITLKSPPKGDYKVVCGIICGPHHDDMIARLIVE